jgi:hypothetical protein
MRGLRVFPERGLVAVTVFLFVATGVPCTSIGQVIYESAALSAVNQSGGIAVASNASLVSYVGVRFQISTTVTATGIGGDFGAFSTGNGELFGAIIGLPDADAFPLSANPLDTPDLLAATTFNPSNPASDVSAPIGPVTLAPGYYALLFGSGQFGATGQGFAPPGNDPVGSPSYITYVGTPTPGQWETYVPTEGLRFFVTAPEPSSVALLCVALGLALARQRYTNGHYKESPCTPSK